MELRSKLRHLEQLRSHVILLIGSNDLKRNVPEQSLRESYLALVKFLLRRVKRIILVATPVIPRCAKDPHHFLKLQFLNDLVYSFQSDPRVAVVDLNTYKDGKVMLPHFFEPTFHDGRIDQLHLNAKAFCCLLEKLKTFCAILSV